MPVRRQVRRPPHARRIGAGRRNSRQLFSLIIRWLGSAFTSTDSVECVDDQAAIQKHNRLSTAMMSSCGNATALSCASLTTINRSGRVELGGGSWVALASGFRAPRSSPQCHSFRGACLERCHLRFLFGFLQWRCERLAGAPARSHGVLGGVVANHSGDRPVRPANRLFSA